MENLVFLKPIIWIIFFIVGLFFLYVFYRTKNFNLDFRFISDLQKVFWKTNKIFLWHLFFLFVILLLISIIISDPNTKNTYTETKRKWIDIVLTLDLSYSMMAEDMKPNRLELAKQVLYNFVSQIKNDRVWLVVFSWKPFVASPLTFDYNFLKEYIKKIDINTINQDYQHLQWTAIWDALLYSAWLFWDNNDREKVIVLFTDWEANRWIDPIEAIRFVKEKNITVHTVWIAGDKETYVIFKNIYWTQKIPIWWIDEKNLKTIASLTNWKYYRVKDEKTFMQIFENLNLLQKKEIKTNTFIYFTDLYKYIYFALFFVSIIYFIYFLYYKDLQIWNYLIFYLIFLLFIFISFLGTKNFNKIDTNKKNINSSDIVFTLDIWASMLAYDNDNKTRLEEAKEFIKEYITKNPQNRYSFVIFSWEAVSMLPFTNDIDLFLNMLESIDNSFIPKNWTNIKDAFLESLNRFNEYEGKTWWIIFLSDFELHTKENIKENTIKSISKLKSPEIKMVFIWIWSTTWSKIIEWRDFFWDIIYKKDKFWRDIITYLDIDFTNKLNKVFNWNFFHLKNTNDIKNIISNIPKFPSKNIDFESRNKKNITYYFAYILCILFYFYILLYFFNKKKLWKLSI